MFEPLPPTKARPVTCPTRRALLFFLAVTLAGAAIGSVGVIALRALG